jgi:hypothetical protein
MSISPAGQSGPMIADQLPPLPIKRLNQRHGKQSDNEVLSHVLVETPQVLPISARCCQELGERMDIVAERLPAATASSTPQFAVVDLDAP